jgi:hypothetical protein
MLELDQQLLCPPNPLDESHAIKVSLEHVYLHKSQFLKRLQGSLIKSRNRHTKAFWLVPGVCKSKDAANEVLSETLTDKLRVQPNAYIQRSGSILRILATRNSSLQAKTTVTD